MFEEFLWVERYRPHTIAETILPSDLKQTFQQFVDQKNIPNLLLAGPAGTGKTTVAKAMLEELGCDYIVINGSLNGNIDTLRNEITQFASTVSFAGGRKYVILDEADYLNANSTQPALRNFIEEYSKSCGFIMTCNFKNRIIGPLSDSRFAVINFKFNKKELQGLASQMLKRVCGILDTEGVSYDKAVVAEIMKKHIPDWRRVLGELQRYSATGRIDTGILSKLSEESLKTLVGYLKGKDFTAMRRWVAESYDTDTATFFRGLYDMASEYLVKNSIPNLVLILSKYQYQAAFVADPEINIAACLTEMMIELEYI